MPSGPRSFAEQRRDDLLRAARAQGSILVREMAERLAVSELTIRRDITELATRGLLTRVHGGAILVEGPTFTTRQRSRPTAQTQPEPQPGERFTLGMVVPDLEYYWPAVIAGARAAAAEARVRLTLRASSYDIAEDRRQIRALTETSRVDGLIVAPESRSEQIGPLLSWLDSLPLPVVLTERRVPATLTLPRLEWAVSDHQAGAAMAVQHLFARGHRRIALLLRGETPTATQLVTGWHLQCRALGLDDGSQLVRTTGDFAGPRRQTLMNEAIRHLRRHRVTAVIMHPDQHALSFVQHCSDTGVAVPGDLAVVAYDDELAALGQPPITAVRPPKHYVGRLAVELLVARLLEGERRPPHRVTISPVLQVRETSGPPSTV